LIGWYDCLQRQKDDIELERRIRHQMRLYRREPVVVDDLPVEISSSEDEEEQLEEQQPGNYSTSHLV